MPSKPPIAQRAGGINKDSLGKYQKVNKDSLRMRACMLSTTFMFWVSRVVVWLWSWGGTAAWITKQTVESPPIGVGETAAWITKQTVEKTNRLTGTVWEKTNG